MTPAERKAAQRERERKAFITYARVELEAISTDALLDELGRLITAGRPSWRGRSVACWRPVPALLGLSCIPSRSSSRPTWLGAQRSSPMHDLKIARQKAWIERRRAESALAPAEPAPTPKAAPVPVPVRLPAWPDAVRAVPNGFLRSAIFGAIKRGARRYLKAELVAAVEGTEIRYTGERLDQGDLDVWESVLHAVRTQELGSQCRVTSYALLKLMGLTDTGKNRATLHTRITRLVANAVEVKQGRYTYIGGLISLLRPRTRRRRNG